MFFKTSIQKQNKITEIKDEEELIKTAELFDKQKKNIKKEKKDNVIQMCDK